MQFNTKMISLAGAFAFAGFASAAEEQIVKIGHVGPISGSIAHLGKDNENGGRMAIEELNAKGLTIGGKKIKFELQAEDDAGDPKQTEKPWMTSKPHTRRNSALTSKSMHRTCTMR